MTVVIDLPPHLAERVEADAVEQGRDAADVVRNALADWYDEDDEYDSDDIEAHLPADIYKTHPLPPFLSQPLYESLREGFADADAGRIIEGEVFLAELRARIAGYKSKTPEKAVQK